MKLNDRKKRALVKRIAIGAVGAAVLAVGSLAIGAWSGRALAEATRERLALLWPEIMTMPAG